MRIAFIFDEQTGELDIKTKDVPELMRQHVEMAGQAVQIGLGEYQRALAIQARLSNHAAVCQDLSDLTGGNGA